MHALPLPNLRQNLRKCPRLVLAKVTDQRAMVNADAIDLVPSLMAVDFVCRYASVELTGVTDVV